MRLGTAPSSGRKWEEDRRRRTWTETGTSGEKGKKKLVERNSCCYSAVAPLLEFLSSEWAGREWIFSCRAVSRAKKRER